MIDLLMCFKQGDVSYLGPNDTEGGLRQIVREAVIIHSEDA